MASVVLLPDTCPLIPDPCFLTSDSCSFVSCIRILTFEGVSGINYDGSGQVLVGLLDFKSSGPAKSRTVGSIPMHFRHHASKTAGSIGEDMGAEPKEDRAARGSVDSLLSVDKRRANVWYRNA